MITTENVQQFEAVLTREEAGAEARRKSQAFLQRLDDLFLLGVQKGHLESQAAAVREDARKLMHQILREER